MNSVHKAVLEVGTPVIFGIGVIILVFLPLMTLEGMEGKMFSPLAFTIAIALGISLVLSLTLTPVLSSYLLKGGAEHDTKVVQWMKRPYLWLLHGALAKPKTTIAAAVLSFVGAMMLFPYLGTSFIPELKEGTISPNMDRVPNISLDESIKMEMEAMRTLRKLPGVKFVVSRLGRGESPVDPAGYNESDMMIQLLPLEERKGLTQDAIGDGLRLGVAELVGGEQGRPTGVGEVGALDEDRGHADAAAQHTVEVGALVVRPVAPAAARTPRPGAANRPSHFAHAFVGAAPRPARAGPGGVVCRDVFGAWRRPAARRLLAPGGPALHAPPDRL